MWEFLKNSWKGRSSITLLTAILRYFYLQMNFWKVSSVKKKKKLFKTGTFLQLIHVFTHSDILRWWCLHEDQEDQRGWGFEELIEKYKSGITSHKIFQILFTLLQWVYFLDDWELRKNCLTVISNSRIATNKITVYTVMLRNDNINFS